MNFLLDLLRLSFKFQTGRSVYKVDGFFIKRYADRHECIYEYTVLKKIANANPNTFLVPKIFKMGINPEGSFIVMERIEGNTLQNYIMNFLLFKEDKSLRIFEGLGKALRELHYINLKDLHNGFFPDSLQEIKLEISKLSRRLEKLHILGHKFRNKILNIVEKATHVNDEIFANVNLHGEFYFTHIILSKGKYIFFDFHRACKGPSYFDLAMLSTSLYASLTLPLYTSKQLTPLIYTFLTGYFGKSLNDEIIKSTKLAELYVTLREILTYAKTLYNKSSQTNKLIATIKIRKIEKAIKEVILPSLIFLS